ncbi:MAG: carbohydrate kinase [Christensenellales bacterium]
MGGLLTFGELLVDLTPAGETDGRKLFMQNPGGAVANVAAAACGFGIESAFMGMVGDDVFGNYLVDVLDSKGVDTSSVVKSDLYNTTLAIVHLFDNGDRDFSFYRKPGADIMFSADMIDERKLRGISVFHFGSLSFTDEPVRGATFSALDIAKKAGVTISYDPNYRAALWGDKKTAKEYMLKGLEYADILKISDNEVDFLFGKMPYKDAAKMLVSRGIKLVFVTMGGSGAVYANRHGAGHAQGFAAKMADATGAGDCFTAAALSKYLNSGKGLNQLSLEDAHGFALFANAAASLCVEKMGGIPAMPSLKQAEERLKTRGCFAAD